ncbi:uncharacterized protein HMPREF1541_06081 [Cyphellophora europaea CBS 101466]|uniref:Mediator of RNA polymerase II transcription subunit 22 n=1 Tax=Cyphellophora europaea (strain CBS 101466) TaxID=1220924 RepID=W2RU71_CYPE1|nr:uncharacterized protein HMPREF1541_06081 [Cyphellophora europaea CBS 101466]ETN39855.1 hypothetical protein HMPREF1541_06081 [Cyphellophora europaea CBS 101466]
MADTTTPSAKYLQARISHLSLTLLQRFQALLDTAHDAAEGEDGPVPGSDAPSLSPEDVASKQLDIEVGSTALIRAAEEIMVLTRGMKELWLFGGLDTLAEVEGKGDGKGKEEERRRLLQEMAEVRGGLQKWLREYPHVRDGGEVDEGAGKRESEEERGEAEMAVGD